MVSRKRKLEVACGILVGYTSRWNPFTTKVNVLINVNGKVMKIPIDYRQLKFVQKEYAVGSKVEIESYEGNWRIKSEPEPINKFYLDEGATFIAPSNNAYK
jgi:hypothetical protein